MTTKRKLWRHAARAGLLLLVVGLVLVSYDGAPRSVRAAIRLSAPFDFNDDFYAKNGVAIAKTQALGPDSRVGFFEASRNGVEFGTNPANFNGQYNWIEDNTNTDPTRGGTRGGIRIAQTTGGFDKDGNLIYYSILAPLPHDGFFTQDAAGVRAHTLANQFRAFIFPKQIKSGVMQFDTCPVGTQPGPGEPGNCVVLNPGPGNRRQDNLFETKNEYFCGNLLGLWLIEMVLFTPQSQTPQGQQALAALVAENGANLDGTPVFKTLDQINQLVDAGYARLAEFPAGPHPGPGTPRYVV